MVYARSIFIEALRAMLSPMHAEITAPAMHAFGGYDMMMPVMWAALGSIAAVALLWIVGRTFMPVAHSMGFNAERYSRLQIKARPYIFWTLPLVWTPLGPGIAAAAGFFRFPLWQTLAIAAIGVGWWYFWAWMG